MNFRHPNKLDLTVKNPSLSNHLKELFDSSDYKHPSYFTIIGLKANQFKICSGQQCFNLKA